MPDSINTQPPNIDDEAPEMAEGGRIIKARFPRRPRPNTSWFWIGRGNCQDCVFYQGATSLHGPRCLNPEISEVRFWRYVNDAGCPEFTAGIDDERAQPNTREADTRDAMRAAGLTEGAPSQKTLILKNVPWTRRNSELAHAQQARIQSQARYADTGYDPDSEEVGADDDDG